MCPTACVRLTRASRVGELVSTSAPGATASMKALRASIGYLRRPIVRTHRRMRQAVGCTSDHTDAWLALQRPGDSENLGPDQPNSPEHGR